MAKIKEITAREILDSRGNPTVEATVVLDNGIKATASCPSGKSIGTYEAAELRDKDEKRYQGLGVLAAVSNVETLIAPKLIGMDAESQQQIDKILVDLDGTPNKKKLGANATLPVSIAVCKAASLSASQPTFLYLKNFIQKINPDPHIPVPLFNLINGGKHANGNADFQEFLVIPASSKPYSQALENGVQVFHALSKILAASNLTTLVGDEGGYGPKLSTNIEGFTYLKQALDACSLRLGFDAFLGLDAAANSFYKNKGYVINNKPNPYSTQELITYYTDLNSQFPLLYLEDPLFEDDWDGWVSIFSKMSRTTLIVGDDLTTTNPFRLQMAMDKKAISGIIIKPNQIGTVIEAIAVAEVAKQAGIKVTVSHRSGETNDDFIADFAVAISADYVKFGAPNRGERVAKYNRLLQIERELTNQSPGR